MSSFDIWLRKGPSMKYVRNWSGYWGSSKMRTAAYRGGGVTPHVYKRTHTISFHDFGNIFVSVLFSL